MKLRRPRLIDSPILNRELRALLRSRKSFLWLALFLVVLVIAFTIAWSDGSSEQALVADHVAPIPDNPELRAEELAFCKWQGTTQWWQSRIERVEGEKADVMFQDGSTARVAVTHCVRGRPGRNHLSSQARSSPGQ